MLVRRLARSASCIRSFTTLDFGGTREIVYERQSHPRDHLQGVLGDDTLAVIGYGTQGRAQSLNARDNGLNVVIGLRKNGPSWALAQKDGWTPGKTLFSIAEAADRGSVIMNLLSDAGQKSAWPELKQYVTKGKTLYFSHGFAVVYGDQTGVVPPDDVDVVLVAPKGSGTTVRSLFLDGRGINSSIAIHQYASANKPMSDTPEDPASLYPPSTTLDRTVALGFAVGSGYLYQTTFQREVYSDLVGERGILMGALQGLMQAQYEVLRERGHSPSEAFNETVEEATQSLYPLVGQNGMDWMYSNCSATAQRGALDWYPRFMAATKPLFNELYDKVASGAETQRTLDTNSRDNYRAMLKSELDRLDNMEMWQAGKTVRQLRPETIAAEAKKQ
ncbi:Bifunctional acetohydroxyacid reductoisomerase [Sorochytrium milnesiophthora]